MLVEVCGIWKKIMGNFDTKGRLSDNDINFLLTHTSLDKSKVLNLHRYFMACNILFSMT